VVILPQLSRVTMNCTEMAGDDLDILPMTFLA